MSWLKKRFEEAVAQISPFDNGKTASTVRAARPKPAPVQTINRDSQPGFQITNNSLTRGLSRGFDQVNMYDNNRTWQQRTPTNTLSSVDQFRERFDKGGRSNKEQLNRVVGGAAQVVSRAPQGLMAAGHTLGDKGFRPLYNAIVPGTKYDITSNELKNTTYTDELFQLTGKAADISDQKIAESRFGAKEGDNIVGDLASGFGSLGGYAALTALTGGAGATTTVGMNALGQGTNESVNAGRDLSDATVRQAPGAVAQAALEKFGYGKLLKPFGGNATTRLVSRGVSEGTQEALQEITGNLSAKLDYDQQRSPFEGAGKAALLGGIIGGGASLPLELAAPTTKLVSRVRSNPGQAVSDTVQNVKRAANPVAAQFDDQIATLETMRATATPREQVNIGKAIDGLIQERARTLQGGFIAGPLAGDFSSMKKQGKVFEGVDGKPRFEVSDEGAKLKTTDKWAQAYNGEPVDLGSLLDHKELYKQYPELKDNTVVKFVDSESNGSMATRNGVNFLTLSKKLFMDDDLNKSTMLHEIQHAIQNKEGFAKGSTGINLDSKVAEIDSKMDYIKRSKNYELWKKKRDSVLNDKTLTATQRDSTIKQMESNLPDAVKSYRKLSDEKLKLQLDGNKGYYNTAGEAEARAVSTRMNMSDGERQGKQFYDSLDVPKEDLIIRNGSGKAMSVDPKAPQVGKTETLYHGSDKPIKEMRLGEGMQGRGVYLTNNQDRATMYGSKGADGVSRTPVITKVTANIKNPIESTKVYTRDMFGDTGDAKLNGMLDTAFDAYNGKLDGENLALQLRVGQDNSLLEKLGFDAYKSNTDTVVFNPKNVITENQSTPAPQVGKTPKPQFESDLEVAGLKPSRLPQTNDSKAKVKQGLPQKEQGQAFAPNQLKETTKQAPLKQSPANQPSKKVVSSKSSPNTKLDSTPKTDFEKSLEAANLKPKTEAQKFAKTFGVTEQEAKTNLAREPESTAITQAELETITDPEFNAVAGRAGSKNSNKLVKAIQEDKQLTKALINAQNNGTEINYYAKKDANGRSVGIERFNPSEHRIEAGFVVDKNQNVLGNHIKVDKTGIQVNVGGKLVNMESVIGNPLEWGSKGKVDKSTKGRYKLSETMNRNIDNNAPTPEIAESTKSFLWSAKVQAEANLRTELDTEYKKLGDRIKQVESARPRNVGKEIFKDDIFSVLNGDKSDADIKKQYAPQTARAILQYKSETRSLYNSLLERVNTERVKFGQEPIAARKDYITHLQEMNQNKGFVTEVYGQMKNSFADEGMGKTRGGVPGDIAGRTENFKPISKYNPFLQRRTGTTSMRDPFLAVQEYLQPALYNIHMTEAGARARAVESAFRTAEQLRQMQPDQVVKEANSILDNYKKGGDNSKLVSGFQEYANAIAGKTQRFDRQLIDSSDTAAMGVKGWQGLQRIGGRGTILGNLSSVLAQPLNQVVGLADAGGINYVKGIAASLTDSGPIEQSDFIRARSTEPTKTIRSAGTKITDAGSVPLQAVELASVRLMWQTQYQKALSEGHTGTKAVQQADLNTERLVAGRGIADKPEVYRSTVANGILQYTLEVNAQNKAFWQDLDTTQKAKFMVAATAVNTLMAAITGYEPLPDFLKALYETGDDFLDEEDERSGISKAWGGTQRMADQYASMNPLISGVANILPQDMRKTVFGTDSDLGRFAGGSAPVGVIKNTVSAVSHLTKGEYQDAAEDAIRNVPFGNQIRKTATGAELIKKGYAEDWQGNVTHTAPTSAIGKAQVLAFGPNSSKEARQYYDEKDAGLSKDQRERLRDAPEGMRDKYKEEFLAQNKAKAKAKSDKEKALSDSGSTTSKLAAIDKQSEERLAKLKASLSPDDYLISTMSKAEKAEVVRLGIKTQAEMDGLDSYVKNKKSELGYNSSSKTGGDTYTAKYKAALEKFNKEKNSYNKAELLSNTKKLNRLKVSSEHDEEIVDLYALNKADVYNLVSSDPKGNEMVDKLIAYGDKLVEAGVIQKNKFRTKYGGVSIGSSSRGGGSGRSGGGRGSRGGKKNKFDYKLDMFADTNKITKSLRQLLKEATL